MKLGSITKASQIFELPRRWFYNNIKDLDPVLAKINGRPIRPYKINLEKLRKMLDGELTTEVVQSSLKAEYREKPNLFVGDDEKEVLCL